MNPERSAMENDETVLAVDGLSLVFANGHNLFSDVSFSITRGQRVAIIGANGAGKSTLVRASLGMVPAARALNIELFGQPITKMRPGKRRALLKRVGFVHQRHNLVGRTCVLGNVLHGAMARTHFHPQLWSDIWAPAHFRSEAMAMLERVRLPHKAAERVSALSGGQSQRVAIARALMQKPELIIADEPVASLDPVAGVEVMDLFAELVQEQGATFIFVSHDLEHALHYADRIIGVRGGRLDMDAPAESLSMPMLEKIYGEAA